MSELPQAVHVREVGPRDGFQNEPEVIPTADKVRLIELLGATGLRRIEVTSFVRPDVIPQLADAEQVLESISLPDEVAVSVLIPNERGLDRALSAAIAFRRSTVPVGLGDPQPEERRPPGGRVARRSGADLREGPQGGSPLRRGDLDVVRVSVRGECRSRGCWSWPASLADAGCEEVAFGDTTGMANPLQVGILRRGP